MSTDTKKMNELNLEDLIYRQDFIQPLFFPCQTTWEDHHILYVGESIADKGFQVLGREFPGARVHFLESGDAVVKENLAKSYDYIAAVGLKSTPHDIGQVLTRLISLLKPDGVMAAAVYGYTGCHGLNMLSILIKKIARDLSDPLDNKNIAKIRKIAGSVIEQLPGNHPARRRRDFLERLEKGDKKTLRELFNLSPGNIFTVSRLLECVEQGRGRLIDWVLPNCYDPAQYVKEKDLADKLGGLAGPKRWIIAELVNAWPPEHYFFLGGRDYQSPRIAWDSGDLYLWRPKRLPLYQWEDLNKTNSGEGILAPVKECRGIDAVELQPWQARLCLAASGSVTLDRLLADIKKPHAEVIDFLHRALERRLLALLPPG
jgi:SAM-dependent methyltransferase